MVDYCLEFILKVVCMVISITWNLPCQCLWSKWVKWGQYQGHWDWYWHYNWQNPFLMVSDIILGPVSSIHGNPTTYCYYTRYTGSMENWCNSNRIIVGKRRWTQYCFLGAVRNFDGERQSNGIGKEGTVGTECWRAIGTERGGTLSIGR